MKKSVMKLYLALWMVLCSGFAGHAADLPESLKDIQALQHVSENLYTAGQPKRESFAILAKAGVRHLINLRPPSETPELNEAAVVTQANMAYYNIPISGPEDWTRDNVKLLDHLLRKLEKEKVLLHCSSSNRVGALIALRAVWINGLPLEEAISEGRRHGLTKLEEKVRQFLAQ